MSPWKLRLDLFGSVLGVLGMILVALAIVLRLTLGSAKPGAVLHAPQSILLVGIASIAAGCWFKLTAR
jgi:hypothetical protein